MRGVSTDVPLAETRATDASALNSRTGMDLQDPALWRWSPLALLFFLGWGLPFVAASEAWGRLVVGSLGGLLLAGWLWRLQPQTRWQAIWLVVLATGAEHVLTGVVGAYSYLGGGVPMYVPFGHGLVYLASLSLAQMSGGPLSWGRWRQLGTVAVLGWAGWHLWHGTDVWGVAFSGLLLWALWRRSQWRVYLACFLVTTVLELWGTAWGSWTWAPMLAGFSMANPPCGVAGAYAGGDAIAGRLGRVMRRWAASKSSGDGARATAAEPERSVRSLA